MYHPLHLRELFHYGHRRPWVTTRWYRFIHDPRPWIVVVLIAFTMALVLLGAFSADPNTGIMEFPEFSNPIPSIPIGP